MTDQGNFAYGGVQRSYSFPVLHGDKIPNSESAAQCPDVDCEQVFLQNDPDSTGNIIVGGERLGAVATAGIVLEPGNVTGWIPIKNLNLVWHLDADATSTLNYLIVR